eukprot:COSAG02_NODE_14642_length_1252_cov_1.008673_1_plen_63_part_10
MATAFPAVRPAGLHPWSRIRAPGTQSTTPAVELTVGAQLALPSALQRASEVGEKTREAVRKAQ